MTIKLLIADDHDIVRAGIRNLLADEDIKIVGEATDGETAVKKTLRSRPHVVLMDVLMPGMDGLDAMELIRGKKLKVIVISGHDNPTYIARAVALGAHNFLPKTATGKEFIAAIHAAVDDQPPADDSLFAAIREILVTRDEPCDNDVSLTKRQHQVLQHLAFGLSNREVAFSLDISVEAIKEHVKNILRKLDAQDRTEAAVWAVKRGLVDVA